MNEIPVKITLLPGAELPKYAKPGDSGFDLVAQEDYVVEPGETVKVRTGIRIELPEGLEVQIRPRSGVSANTKLRVANSPGTGDSSYRGEICVLIDNLSQEFAHLPPAARHVYNDWLYEVSGKTVRTAQRHKAGTYVIRKGERIAQAVIAPVYRASFEVVTELTETERGVGGFGHTGVSV